MESLFPFCGCGKRDTEQMLLSAWGPLGGMLQGQENKPQALRLQKAAKQEESPEGMTRAASHEPAQNCVLSYHWKEHDFFTHNLFQSELGHSHKDYLGERVQVLLFIFT